MAGQNCTSSKLRPQPLHQSSPWLVEQMAMHGVSGVVSYQASQAARAGAGRLCSSVSSWWRYTMSAYTSPSALISGASAAPAVAGARSRQWLMAASMSVMWMAAMACSCNKGNRAWMIVAPGAVGEEPRRWPCAVQGRCSNSSVTAQGARSGFVNSCFDSCLRLSIKRLRPIFLEKKRALPWPLACTRGAACVPIAASKGSSSRHAFRPWQSMAIVGMASEPSSSRSIASGGPGLAPTRV